MDTALFGPLRSALQDRSQFVRMGAAAAVHHIAPREAAGLLGERADALRMADTAPDETALLAIELARSGSAKAVAFAASLLKDDRENVVNVLNTGDSERWVGYIDARGRIAGLSERARETLNPYLAAWNEHGQEDALVSQPTPDAARRSNALQALEYWQQAYAGEGASFQALSERKLGAVVERLNAFDLPRARDDLIAVALTEPNPVLRDIAYHTLPAFGLDGSAQLLATLSGRAGLEPGRDVYPSFMEEARARLNGVKPRALAAFFASQALQRFTDDNTARALTSAAIAWDGTAQARAARVLANMPVETALPELIWSSLNRPDAAGRQAAHKLFNQILNRDRVFGIEQHRFGLGEAIYGNLDWLADVADRAPSTLDWTGNPDIAIPVLREAIALMPRRALTGAAGETAQATLSRATDFARSMPQAGFIDTVKKRLGFGHTAARPETRLPRYPQTRFPERCHIGDEITLAVRLLPTAADGTSQPFDVPFAEGRETTDLLVLVHSAGFNTAESHGVLHVPREGPSDTATFHLRAREIGEWVLDIKFMLDTAELYHCVVPTAVTQAATSGTATVNPIEDFTEASLHRHGEASAVLSVKMNRESEELEWSLLVPGAEKPRQLGRSPLRFNKTQIDKWNKQHAQVLTDFVEKDLNDLAGALAQISGIGSGLFQQIAPPAVADELAKLPADALVVIESDADWVPWELLATDAGSLPLGQRFVLVRAPLVTEPPKTPPNPPQAVSPTLERALVIVGDMINDGTHLHERTFGNYSDRARPPLVEPDWNSLRSTVKDKDIIHFVCHGRGENLYLSYAGDPGSRLSINQVSQLGFHAGAVVFANACRSATASPLLSDFQSFGRAFYLAGARPYIGTLGPVPQSLAVEFSAMFYSYFALEGLPAAQAMRMTRQQAAKTFKRPVWLFYCLYGNTSVTRRWSAAK